MTAVDGGIVHAAGAFAARTAHQPSWRDTARPDQLPPEGWRRTWYVRGGRGSGKTWTASNVLAELIIASPPGEWGVVAPTFGDARDICLEGQESGLIAAFGAEVGSKGLLRVKGPHIEQWNRSNGQLRLVNGSVVFADGADDGAYRIQGHNLRGLWGDEVGLWRNWKTAWEESIRYAVRLAPAKIMLTGTPKRSMPARVLIRALLDDPKVAKSRLLTEDNRANLDPDTLAEFLSSKGTALERQELEGELLNEAEGALWSFEMIELWRVTTRPPSLIRAVVGVDPAATSRRTSDSTGIIAAGTARDGQLHAYVLADRTLKAPPARWGKAAVDLYDELAADKVVGEVNNGGEMVGHVIHTVPGLNDRPRSDVAYKAVTASRGKALRAEPIAALYSAGRVHHVGTFTDLEDQMTQWVPGETPESPDRLDALVWALTELMLGAPGPPTDWAPVSSPKVNEWAPGTT